MRLHYYESMLRDSFWWGLEDNMWCLGIEKTVSCMLRKCLTTLTLHFLK